MKTLSRTTNNQAQNDSSADKSMKGITSVSPFLLLLAPVFLMMLFSFSFNQDMSQEDAALKSSSPKAINIFTKASKVLFN